MGVRHEAKYLTQEKMWEQHKTKPRMNNYLDKFNLGTWNVHSLYVVDAPTVVESNLEQYRIAITAIHQ